MDIKIKDDVTAILLLGVAFTHPQIAYTTQIGDKVKELVQHSVYGRAHISRVAPPAVYNKRFGLALLLIYPGRGGGAPSVPQHYHC